MQKLIALYGGSFNPSTTAHYEMGLQMLKELQVDEVWYLVSPQNPLKSVEDMASFAARLELARINVQDNPKLIVQDLEGRYAAEMGVDRIDTAKTLSLLAQNFSQNRFIWTMGADNFAEFHTWTGDRQYIINNYPIAVLRRLGHTQRALVSDSANIIPNISVEDMRCSNGWHMMNNEENNIQATDCRPLLKAGICPPTMRPQVAARALQMKDFHHPGV
jgi:nicotinate-nucleotide adenylyltransferase